MIWATVDILANCRPFQPEPLEGVLRRLHAVDADDCPPLYRARELSHSRVLSASEFHPVSVGAPIGWVEIEERVQAVVFDHATGPRKVLYVRSTEAQMGSAQVRLEAQQIEPRFRRRCDPELSPFDSSAEAELLQIEEACRSLDIGQRIGDPLVHLPPRDHLFELLHELFQMLHNDPVGVDQSPIMSLSTSTF